MNNLAGLYAFTKPPYLLQALHTTAVISTRQTELAAADEGGKVNGMTVTGWKVAAKLTSTLFSFLLNCEWVVREGQECVA